MNTTYWLNTIMKAMYTDNNGDFYIGLSSTMPEKDGSGATEPSGGNYARVKIESFSEPADGMVNNINELSFPRSTGVWFDSDNKARYWVLFDGSTPEAKILSAGELEEAKTIESNTQITIAAATLSVTLTDYLPA